MSASTLVRILALAPGVVLDEGPRGGWLRRPSGAQEVPAELLPATRILASGGASEEVLAAATNDPAGRLAWLLRLRLWWQVGMLQAALAADGVRHASVLPTAPGVRFRPAPVEPGARWRLSRFACLRREGAELVAESPRAAVRVTLHQADGAAVFASLATPASFEELASRCGGPDVRAWVEFFAWAGLAGVVDSQGELAEDVDPVVRAWEFHDLLFHARSRLVRRGHERGATYPRQTELPPAVTPTDLQAVVDLPAPPEPGRLADVHPSFAEVMEGRRSWRSFGADPLTLSQLGEFLHRVARVRQIVAAPPAEGRSYEVALRPYPNAGAMYELELYPCVRACAGLEPGLYRYDPVGHRLERRSGLTEDALALLEDARRAAGLEAPPQVLLSITSRFLRPAWKYSGIAYGLTLKNVGVLFQSMYLVATAMGLAPCALGGGDAELFARAAGTSPEGEPAVGEFVLGSRPAPARPG